MIILSGGIYGGLELQWDKIGILDDGREYTIINNLVYVKVSESQAVFYGLE